MPHHGMTPHISGSSLSAQARYAAGTREILECWFENRPIREEYLIVQGGRLAGAGAHSYKPGDATGGSEEAARFKARARRPEPGRRGPGRLGERSGGQRWAVGRPKPTADVGATRWLAAVPQADNRLHGIR